MLVKMQLIWYSAGLCLCVAALIGVVFWRKGELEYPLDSVDYDQIHQIQFIMMKGNQEELVYNFNITRRPNVQYSDNEVKDSKGDRYELNSACVTLLRSQVNLEMHASLVYMNMAAHFDRNDIARKGMAKMFRKNSEEEREHAQKLIDYLNIRGSKLTQLSIDMPVKSDWNSGLEAFNDAIILEKEVYNQLHHIHDIAEIHCKDSHLMDFLEREYFVEQVESIDDFIRHSSVLGGISDHVLGEYLYDKHILDKQLA